MDGRAWYFPWMGNTFDSVPYLLGGGARPPEDRPLVLPLPVFKVFSVAVLGLLGGAAAHLVLRPPGRWLRGIREWAGRQPAAVILLAVFAGAYLPLLLFKLFVPHSYGIWDRYLLPVMPLATIGLLGAWQRAGRRRMPAGAWVALWVFAGYGVAQSHDYFAQLRARIEITGRLERLGIERVRILGGFEYDGWTQISVAGHYNDPRIVHPPGTHRAPSPDPGFRTLYQMWRRHTPVVTPDYVIALGRHPELFDTGAAAGEYACWLPPFRRRVWVQVRDPALVASIRPLDRPEPGRLE
jgi:hypothetical protein